MGCVLMGLALSIIATHLQDEGGPHLAADVINAVCWRLSRSRVR